MRRKAVTLFADYVVEAMAQLMGKWVKEQVRMREIAIRSSWQHGGGVAGIVLFHDPAAIR